MKEWQKELYIYRLSPAPPKKDDLQEYIDLYLAEKDETYLSWFLHYYEPTLNTTVMGVVQRYSMFGHFLDIKEACVLGILRALEVYRATGETITAHNARTRQQPPRYDAVMIGLTAEPRSILYDRIDRRVDRMLEQGLLEEVRGLLRDGLLEGTAAQAIGYKELLACIRGETTLEAAAGLIRQKSRNYAKRQLTWFRRDKRIHWICFNAPEAAAAVLQEATDYLQNTLYNG